VTIPDNPILTDDQKLLLEHFRVSLLAQDFYLTGGTALSAFFLHHRLSDDLDFFSEAPVGIEEVLAFVKSLPGISDVQYERKYDRKLFILQFSRARFLKVEFTTYPFPRLEKGPIVEKLQIDSLQDILANKLVAVTDRRDAKDYLDLYCAFKKHPELDIDSLIAQAEAKFGVKGVQHILRGRFLETIPSIGNLKTRESIDPVALTQFFVQNARRWIIRSTEEP
jgi:predicted nucleotidyltransferase component of viral defense system